MPGGGGAFHLTENIPFLEQCDTTAQRLDEADETDSGHTLVSPQAHEPEADTDDMARTLGVTIGMRVTWCRGESSGILQRVIPPAESTDGEGRVAILMDDGSTREILASGVRPVGGDSSNATNSGGFAGSAASSSPLSSANSGLLSSSASAAAGAAEGTGSGAGAASRN